MKYTGLWIFLTYFGASFLKFSSFLLEDLESEHEKRLLKRFNDFEKSVMLSGIKKDSRCKKSKYPFCKGVLFNGCGPEGGPTVFKSSLLTPACDKHDVCYYCAEYYGWTQSQCDDAFKKDTINGCRCTRNKLRKRICLVAATLFHKLVKWKGHKFVTKKSPKWCKCAESYGDVFLNVLV